MRAFNPKVSIIIPVYNGSNYLKEAINSALTQTYENIEIIVVNDGSADDGATEKIAKSFGDQIRYFKKKNGGVATALNLGIDKMRGEYFSWLSHDDLYYPNKIQKQIEFLSNLDDKNIFLYSNYATLRGKRIRPVMHNHEMLVRKPRYSLLRGCVNGITVLVPKKMIDKVGKFNEDLRCVQDYDYWHRLQNKCKFVHMEDILSVTRLHGKQDSVVSPRVLSEGNEIWTNLIENLSNEEKTQYEGSLYNFYTEMAKFLETTIYVDALSYVKKQLDKLKKTDSELLKHKPKVSVVIPFHNRISKTLVAVRSVLDQDYDNIEIVLVDDKSTERLDGLEKLMKIYSNIKLVSLSKNSGPSVARNAGIRKSTGEYIAFLDSDDEFLKNKISHQLAMMLRSNPNFSYTAYLRRSNNEDRVVGGYGVNGLVVPRIISSCPIATPTVMVRRSILTSDGLFFDESINIGEDVRLWLEIAKKYDFLFIPEHLTVVNVNSESTAFDVEKQLTGFQNILTYLTSDSYYSNFSNEISLLCKDFYDMNKKVLSVRKRNLQIQGYARPEWVENLEEGIRKSLAYRVLLKCRNDRVSALIKALVNRLRKI